MALGLVGCVGLLGCQDATLRAEFADCRFHTDIPRGWSNGLPREHCRFRNAVAERLGVAGPSIVYNLVPLDSAEVVCDGRAGCAGAAFVAVAEPLVVHEIVHNVLLSNRLEGTVALQEGAATVWGSRVYEVDEIRHELPLARLTDDDAFQDEETAGTNYEQAASLVSYLLDVAGEPAFVELMARTSYDTGLGDLDAVALDVVGQTMTELHAAWSALPPEPGWRVARPVYECASDPFVSGPLRLVRGVSDSITDAGAFRTFTAERAGELHVTASGVEPRVIVLSCDRGPPVELDDTSADARLLDARGPIAPGRYAMWVTNLLLEGDVAEIDVEVTLEIAP